MIKKILLDGVEKHFSNDNLPMLIHADDGSGGSLFSVSVIADLYDQGAKLIFLCGYHMARDEFESQTNSLADSILLTKSSQIQQASEKKVIFVSKETPELFVELVETLPDMSERTVFFKNFDLFSVSDYESIKNANRLVLMGDIDECSYKTELLTKVWTTKIYFSRPKHELDFDLTTLPKYSGLLKSTAVSGLVTLSNPS